MRKLLSAPSSSAPYRFKKSLIGFTLLASAGGAFYLKRGTEYQVSTEAVPNIIHQTRAELNKSVVQGPKLPEMTSLLSALEGVQENPEYDHVPKDDIPIDEGAEVIEYCPEDFQQRFVGDESDMLDALGPFSDEEADTIRTGLKMGCEPLVIGDKLQFGDPPECCLNCDDLPSLELSDGKIWLSSEKLELMTEAGKQAYLLAKAGKVNEFFAAVDRNLLLRELDKSVEYFGLDQSDEESFRSMYLSAFEALDRFLEDPNSPEALCHLLTADGKSNFAEADNLPLLDVLQQMIWSNYLQAIEKNTAEGGNPLGLLDCKTS